MLAVSNVHILEHWDLLIIMFAETFRKYWTLGRQFGVQCVVFVVHTVTVSHQSVWEKDHIGIAGFPILLLQTNNKSIAIYVITEMKQ